MSVSIESVILNGRLMSFKSTMRPSEDRQKELTKQLEEWERSCFNAGNEECVEETDRLYLQQRQLVRDQKVEQRRHHHACVLALPPYLQSLEFMKHAHTMKDIRAGEAFMKCYEKHVLAMMRLMHEENRLLLKGVQALKEQYGR